ncbi:YwdI family protein [Bacillus sp. AK128]
MNIPLKQILEKMDQELKSALAKDDEQVRDHLLVIRSLCDLVIQERPKNVQMFTPPVPSHSLQNTPKKNIKEDEDANGDSLFDF